MDNSGVVASAIGVAVVLLIGMYIGDSRAMDEAQARGYTEYCQHDGSRVWIGECDQ